MKKLLFLLSMITVFSCEKETCYVCKTSVSGGGGSGTATSTICNVTPREVREIERAGTITSTGSSGSYSVTIRTTTTCHKQ